MKLHWKEDIKEPGWWYLLLDGELDDVYTGWNVAYQVIRHRSGFFLFNDRRKIELGPFKTPEEAKEWIKKVVI